MFSVNIEQVWVKTEVKRAVYGINRSSGIIVVLEINKEDTIMLDNLVVQ